MTDPNPCKPEMTDGPASPGRFVRQQAPEFQGAVLYHGLYLPTDWRPGGKYPVIVEYPGNECKGCCTGRLEECKLGFYQSGGEGFIWLVLPFVDTAAGAHAIQWWGDLEATVEYCRRQVARVCENYGGDAERVFITGFSRGAIACGYVGLHDDRIAALWAGFLPHSHHDGGQFTPHGARERLARIAARPSFITWGSDDGGKDGSLVGKAILQEMGSPVEALEIPGIGHTDEWIMTDSPQRKRLRRWLAEAVKRRER